MQCWGRIPIPFNTSRVGVSDVHLSVFVKKSWSAGCGYGFYKKIVKSMKSVTMKKKKKLKKKMEYLT